MGGKHIKCFTRREAALTHSKMTAQPPAYHDLFRVAEIQVTYRNPIKNRWKITCSDDAYVIFSANWNLDTIDYREEFKMLALNRANEVLGIFNVSSGGTAGTVADPKIIFGAALKAHSSSIIVAHSHPSGNLTPSDADIKLTQKLKEAGQTLDLPVLDHLIITSSHFYSFADHGVL